MKKLAKVFHAELFGKREEKYKSLEENDISSVEWKELKPVEPYYFFVPKDFEAEEEYKKGFGIDELFENFSSGVETAKDSTVIKMRQKEIEEVLNDFQNKEVEELMNKYSLKKEKFLQVTNDLKRGKFEISDIAYRPFDLRKTIYTDMSQGVLWRPRHKTMQHIVEKENLGLVAKRGMSELNSAMCFISNKIIDRRYWSRPGMQGAEQLFPLYLYNPDGTKTINLNPKIVEKIAESVGISFVQTKDFLSVQQKTNDYLSLLDYIYAILHSPAYREKYKEFLKIDFPRIPYPDAFFRDELSDEQGVMTPCSKSKEIFEKLSKYGKELRELHLLQSPKVNEFITTFPESGTNTVEKGYPKFVIDDTVETNCNLSLQQNIGKIYINENQYFGNVPEVAWNFYIGGYQPAQKWLKDRQNVQMNCNSSVQQNCNLSLQVEDIEHYQKMIVALTETEKIMKKIDEIVKFT